jgi:hypothetical protein
VQTIVKIRSPWSTGLASGGKREERLVDAQSAIEANDAGQIAARLADRRRARRRLKTAYRKMRAADKD